MKNRKNWKVILICILILPFMFLFNGCSCGEQTTSERKDGNLTYIVIFYTDTNYSIDPIEVKSGAKILEPDKPVRNGYNFVGWFKDIDRTEAWTFNIDTVNSDMTLFAKWELLSNSD